MRIWKNVIGLTIGALAVGACADGRPIRTSDIDVADGYRIDAVAENLAAPTMVAFDDQGRMLIAESGYRGGGGAKVSRIEADGTKTVLVHRKAFGDQIPVTAVAAHQGDVYVVHAGTVSAIEDGGTLRSVIDGLPGSGDHQANQLVFRDDKLYVAVGTVTNSGVVGPDNAVFGWLTDEARRDVHDVPCQDVVLTDAVFDSENPLGDDPERQNTTAYSPYGTAQPAGTTVPGDVKCNGAVLRANLDGSGLEVVAWGLRNPYGLELGADGELYVTMHGFDARGSRPVEDAWDCVYRITEGAWYGWPDYACDVPVTDDRFNVPNKEPLGFLIANHPTTTPPKPLAKFRPHEATNGFALSPGNLWGPATTAYIALFGDFAPATGTVDRPEGVKVVRLDTTTGDVTDFVANETGGQASRHSAGGLEHPSDVTFGPDGHMYIADWGIARVSEKGLVLEENSGVIWRVRPGEPDSAVPGGISLLATIAGIAGLGAATVALGGLPRLSRAGTLTGAVAGLAGGAVMGVFTMAVAAPALDLPWHAPPRVLATLVAGRKPLANILEFSLPAFALGAVVLVVLTVALGALFGALFRTHSRWRLWAAAVAYSLAGWALLQYVVLPVIQPLVTEKGFTPPWYALSFGVYGIVLGAVLAFTHRTTTDQE